MTEVMPNPPTESDGVARTRFNAIRHGILSRYTVLPWEDADEYDALATALTAEHSPVGPTEQHLVEEVAGILWRKRRLRLAEAAAFRCGLEHTLQSYQNTAKVALAHLHPTGKPESVADAIRATTAETEDDVAAMAADEAMTHSALALLSSRHNDAYEAALAALREDTQGWWADTLARKLDELDDGEEPATADVEGLRGFLKAKVLPWFERRRAVLANRPLIREQALGEALNVHKLEHLGRYEVLLDRKLERMLSMLLRLKDLRQATIPG